MTDKSRTPLRPPLRTRDLTGHQRSLVDLMREHQFGRIENLTIRVGQPILDCDLRVVRVARLGSNSGGTKARRTDDFELKQSVRDLFDELVRIHNGTVVRLEFRHGLPTLLETTMPATRDERPDGPGDPSA